MANRLDSSEEKGLLGPPLKSHRRYGSTTVNMKKPDHIVVHFVNKGDTIQGIALKYGSSVEQLKQHNKLWSSGSLFVHDYLEVPVSQSVYQSIIKKDPAAGQVPSISPSSSVMNGSTCSRESEFSTGTSSSNSSPRITKHSNSLDQKAPPSLNGFYDCSERSPSEILSKIDSNIAIMKSNIERMESFSYPMVDQMEVDDSCKRTHSRHSSESSALPTGWSGHTRYQNGGWKDPTLPPMTVVTNPSRNITMSLKRLLRDHEELYEL